MRRLEFPFQIRFFVLAVVFLVALGIRADAQDEDEPRPPTPPTPTATPCARPCGDRDCCEPDESCEQINFDINDNECRRCGPWETGCGPHCCGPGQDCIYNLTTGHECQPDDTPCDPLGHPENCCTEPPEQSLHVCCSPGLPPVIPPEKNCSRNDQALCCPGDQYCGIEAGKPVCVPGNVLCMHPLRTCTAGSAHEAICCEETQSCGIGRDFEPTCLGPTPTPEPTNTPRPRGRSDW